MTLVKRLCGEMDAGALAAAFLLGVLRTFIYFAVGTLALLGGTVCLILIALGHAR
jgi:hypothetical protein